MSNLFESVQLGSLVLANRVFMAPLTRNRADADGVPGELAATYYSQRASAGLIVTEATQISPMGKGYINTPAKARTTIPLLRLAIPRMILPPLCGAPPSILCAARA